jgi:Leucine-rich repeat (LRR) protein
MKIIYQIFLLLLIPIIVNGQVELLDSTSLAMHPEYTDLSEALKNPEGVIKLSLRKKKYKEFPPGILTLKNLQYLDLSRNNIKELPDSIVNLKNLQYLIVSKTGLTSLPKEIGKMKNLKHLNVNQNELSVLPYSFGELEKLEVADLWSNNLEYFPETMSKLKNLKMMDLRNILIPQKHQDLIQSMLPNTTIYFSPACNCSW